MDFFFAATTSDAPDGESGSVTYGFGSGTGGVSSWTSVATLDVSGDGRADAVRLDFDGDGRRDDAMWDSDGDGRADLAVLDTDDDGRVDAAYSDTGRGLWDHRVRDVPTPSAAGADRAGVEADVDGDGVADDRYVDCVSTDGSPERTRLGLVFAGADPATPTQVFVDTDGDGAAEAVLDDVDGDGVADRWTERGGAVV
ncbi:hypothetical protein KIK15_13415 [Williamsia sp. CHRR-6]|nr:hypothetical protein [Williamsia sp. CHRR-6]